MSDCDEDSPTLPPDTLAILQEFYNEQENKADQLLEAKQGSTNVEDLQLHEDWVCTFSCQCVFLSIHSFKNSIRQVSLEIETEKLKKCFWIPILY